MSVSSTHLAFHINLLKANFNRLLKLPPFNSIETMDASDQDFLEQLVRLVKALEAEEDEALFLGQEVMLRLIRGYPHLMPMIDRDLLWFFGGDCLHYMPDEEIERFQQLDEQRYQAQAKGEAFDYEEARANILQLN